MSRKQNLLRLAAIFALFALALNNTDLFGEDAENPTTTEHCEQISSLQQAYYLGFVDIRADYTHEFIYQTPTPNLNIIHLLLDEHADSISCYIDSEEPVCQVGDAIYEKAYPERLNPALSRQWRLNARGPEESMLLDVSGKLAQRSRSFPGFLTLGPLARETRSLRLYRLVGHSFVGLDLLGIPAKARGFNLLRLTDDVVELSFVPEPNSSSSTVNTYSLGETDAELQFSHSEDYLPLVQDNDLRYGYNNEDELVIEDIDSGEKRKLPHDLSVGEKLYGVWPSKMHKHRLLVLTDSQIVYVDSSSGETVDRIELDCVTCNSKEPQ